MKKEQLTEYREWVESTGKHLRKWPTMSNEQRWYVFMNAKDMPGPRVCQASKVSQTPVGMIWSRK